MHSIQFVAAICCEDGRDVAKGSSDRVHTKMPAWMCWEVAGGGEELRVSVQAYKVGDETLHKASGEFNDLAHIASDPCG